MPALNYANLPDWMQWLIGLVGVIAAILAVIGFVRKVWPLIVSFVKTINALADLPKFMVDTTHTLELQDKGSLELGKKIEEIHHEVHYNNGSSVKDAIRRVENNQKAALDTLARIPEIESGVAGLYAHAKQTDTQIAQARKDIEDTRPVPRKRATPKTKE